MSNQNSSRAQVGREVIVKACCPRVEKTRIPRPRGPGGITGRPNPQNRILLDHQPGQDEEPPVMYGLT